MAFSQCRLQLVSLNGGIGEHKASKKRVNLDKLVEDAADQVCHQFYLSSRPVLSIRIQEKLDAEKSDIDEDAGEEDYDVDEEYDNDYAENYFDNGEGEDDDLAGAGGGDEGGGGE